MTGGLDARRLRFAHGSRMIVDGVDITASRGELTALLGPNGSGKSTLLRMLVGALRADGDITIDGAATSALSRRERAQRIALIEQEWQTAEGLTGRDVVGLGRVPHRSWLAAPDAADDRAADVALHRAGAAGFAARDVSTLSGGERQRVNLARALAQEPSLLLCDEPTNHLDIRAQLDALSLLRSLADDGLAVLASLHDLNHAATYADRVVVIAEGRVRAAGTPLEVLTPALITEVWGVRAEVLARPGSDRPLIAYDPPAPAVAAR